MSAIPIRSLTFVAGLTVLSVGCKRNRDPFPPLDAAKFETSKQLADSLKYLVGKTEPVAWETMNRNGFSCGERHLNIVKDGELALGDLRLECWYEHRINFGLRRRQWSVTFVLDSSRVGDVYASFINQDM
jgi:hypothetical protein